MLSLDDFLEDLGTHKVTPKPWMVDGSHKFLLGTAQTLSEVVDQAIAAGLYSLDLETTGLDNRVIHGETVDKIVGICISVDGITGWYFPVRHKNGTEHNISWSLVKRELIRLVNSSARAIFHRGLFDQEFLQFCGGEPIGEWDDPKKWEDTLILAYLRNSRAKRFGLKPLSASELSMPMIELEELFPEDKRKGKLDFSELDPSWEPVLWYTGADGICTRKLYDKIAPQVHTPEDGKTSQSFIYTIEKLCVASQRWMERSRVLFDQEKAKELIRIGQKEWVESIEEVYKSASEIVGRDIRPGWYRLMAGFVEGHESWLFNTEDVSPSYMERVDAARREADKLKLDPIVVDGKKAKVQTLSKRVPSLVAKGQTEEVAFPVVYDVLSPQQIGALMRECKVPGLKATEKSGQVATSKDELDRVLEEQGAKFPFAGKIKRFREVAKALSTYLLPIIEDCHTDGTLRASFNAHKIDTGRFCCESDDNPKENGGTRFPFHGTPATYDPNRPECLSRVRECIISKPGTKIVAIDFSGVELRIVTNLSLEPKWLREFFHCSSCDHMFESGDGSITPDPPPPFCPVCGSDKIGDLHTLTGLAIYGDDAGKRPDWKQLRQNAKGTNFALCYGGGGGAVDASTGCGKQEGWRIKDQFDKTYRGLKAWWNAQHKFARENGYVLTAFHRRYPLPDINHELGGFRSKAERNATNGPIQGTSADITKIAMGLIYKECKKRGWLEKSPMLLTMHDELVFMIDDDILAEAISVFVPIMNRNKAVLGLKWPVPLTSDVEIGVDWTVPWNLNKIRHSGKWPAELVDLFPEAKGAKPTPVETPVKPVSKEKPVRVYKISAFTYTEVGALAEVLSVKNPRVPAILEVRGPNGENLTGALMTAWGGTLPDVEAEVS